MIELVPELGEIPLELTLDGERSVPPPKNGEHSRAARAQGKVRRLETRLLGQVPRRGGCF
jgi:hypothetical protein